MPEFDVAIVGTGLLGSALAAEGKARGLRVVCVGPGPSTSLAAGELFRLNTWSRKVALEGAVPSVDGDQHPLLSRALRTVDRSRFPRAAALSQAAARVLSASGVDLRIGEVSDLAANAQGVVLTTGRTRVEAKAALLTLGWGAPKVELASPGPVRRALSRGENAFAFSVAMTRLAQGNLSGRTLAVVGAGPSALSFLEACVGLCPRPGVGLSSRQRVLWLAGTPNPPSTPGVRRMFEARYAPLHRRLRRTQAVERVGHRVTSARITSGRWALVDDVGQVHHADALVWCGGMSAPLELISSHARSLAPLQENGVTLALQRISAKGPVPVFQVGPSLDQLGLADWDTGPFCEWFEKGRRLLALLGASWS